MTTQAEEQGGESHSQQSEVDDASSEQSGSAGLLFFVQSELNITYIVHYDSRRARLAFPSFRGPISLNLSLHFPEIAPAKRFSCF